MGDTYNVVVIGGGSAGLVSAYIAATVKAKVALIERHKMGGDCLNTGCVPSKALIKTAKAMATIKNHRQYGLASAEATLDFQAVMSRVHGVIGAIEPHDSVERYTALGVECIAGEASLVDETHVRVGDRVLTTKAIILAMGAAPRVPPVHGLDKVPYLTSENLWQLKTLPRRLIVLGGGPIGCEMAQAFQRLGSAVTLVEMGDRLLPREDPDTATLAAARLAAEGVTLHTGAKAQAVLADQAGRRLVVERAGGVRGEIAFDEILVAVGRKPRSEGVDWAKLGVEVNRDGTLKVDSYLRVNGRNMYACGDLAGPYQLTHVASHQAWYCAVNALFAPMKKFKVDYRVIPWVTFTDPEIAGVGLTEEAAKAQGIPYEVTLYDLADLDRAIAESETDGRIKVLTAPGKDKILGVSIVAPHADEMIAEYVTAMKYGIGLNKILGTIHSYPTFAEANKMAAGVWKKAHAPEGLLELVGKFHKLRR